MERWMQTDGLGRLAVCAAAAAAVVYGARQLCRGKDWPLWKALGPWIEDDQVQAVAVLAVVFYGASLALWPQEGTKEGPQDPEAGFSPCGVSGT